MAFQPQRTNLIQFDYDDRNHSGSELSLECDWRTASSLSEDSDSDRRPRFFGFCPAVALKTWSISDEICDQRLAALLAVWPEVDLDDFFRPLLCS